MPVGASVSGALGAAGSIGSAMIGAGASKQASQQQATMGLLGLIQQQQMFNQAKQALSPFVNAGQSVLPTLQNLLTPGTAAGQLQNMPGFQFQSQWGNLAATNALAAQGLGGSSGPLAKAISDYNNGLAGTAYNSTVGNLQNFANMGLGAGSSLAGNALASGNSQAATLGGIGNAQAAGTLGSANAFAGGITGATGALGNAALLSGLLPNSTGGGSLGGSISNGLGGIYGAVTGEGFTPYSGG